MGIAFLIAAPFFGYARELPFILITFAGIAFSIALAVAFKGKVRLRRDPYDLVKLKQLDDKLALDELQTGDVANDADQIICIRCQSAYRSRFPACPNCGHVPGMF
jgi:hypothetical protein